MEIPRLEDLIPLLPGAGVAIALALVGFALTKRRNDERPGGRDFIAALTLGLACAAGLVVTWAGTHAGLPAITGASSERALWGLAIAGLVLAGACLLRIRGMSLVVQLATVLGLSYFVLRSLIERAPDLAGAMPLGIGLGIGVALLAFAWLSEASLDRERPFLAALCLSFACGAAGQIALLYGSASIGQLAGTLALGLGPLVAILLVFGRAGGVAEAASRLQFSASLAIGTLAMVAWFFLQDPPPATSSILLVVAALAAHLGRLKVFQARPSLRVAVVVGVALICCAVAVWLGVEALPPVEDDPYSEFK